MRRGAVGFGEEWHGWLGPVGQGIVGNGLDWLVGCGLVRFGSGW